MFKTITRTVAAALLVMASPISAEAVTRMEFVERLEDIGIELVSNDCKGSFGMYSPSTNTMCINEDLFAEDQQDLFDETITHEAVHVIQDCMTDDGLKGKTLTPMITALKKRNVDTTGLVDFVNKNFSEDYSELINGMDNEVRALAEIEAYSMEDHHHMVYEILGSACLAK